MSTSISVDPTTGVALAADAVERAQRAGAHESQVTHAFREQFEVSFDHKEVSLIRSTVSDVFQIAVHVDKAVGTAVVTGRSPDEVQAAVENAVAAARAGHPDEANSFAPGAAGTPTDRGEREPDREAMVDVALDTVRALQDRHPKLAADVSTYEFTSRWVSLVNSHGRTQHDRHGQYSAALMITGKDDTAGGPTDTTSFNYGGFQSNAVVGDLLASAPIAQTISDTEASFAARSLPETFTGDVIFTPMAVESLVDALAGAVSGMSLIRQSTPFADKLGEAIASERFSLLHRPHELSGSEAFDGSGFVSEDLDIVRDGVLENFRIGWYTHNKLDRPMTSGGADFVVPSGDESLAEIIARTERGLVFGRFSGGNPGANLDFSGVAKSSFYVENGEIQFPLTETMVSGNFAEVLQSIWAISAESIDTGSSRFPWIATKGMTVSGS